MCRITRFAITSLLLAASLIVPHSSVSGEGSCPKEKAPAFELIEDLVLGVEKGNSGDVFGRISDIAVNSFGEIYVLDTGYYRIQRFDSNGEFLGSIGGQGEGPGFFTYPTALAIDASDKLYVGDLGRISVFAREGTYKDSIPRKNPGAPVMSMAAVHGVGLFVVEFSGSDKTLINKYNLDGDFDLSFCHSYAFEKDVDVRAERVFAGGSLAGVNGALIFSQRYPYEIRKFSFMGELQASLPVDSEFMLDPIFESEGNKIRAGLRSGCYSLVSIGKMGLLNSLVVKPENTDDAGCTRIDWIGNDLRVKGGQTFSGRLEIRCVDKQNRVWAIVNNEVPQIVRLQWGP